MYWRNLSFDDFGPGILRRLLAGVLATVGLLGCPDGPLSPVAPCVTGETRECLVPPCPRSGIQFCLEGEWGPCLGHQEPTIESCNGRDDDCNGIVDDDPRDPEIGAPCGSDAGRCKKGTVRCFNGELICFGAIVPRAEECNGLDDDCDGIIDNNLIEELCYSGPPETRGVGICRSGLQRCVGGKLVCEFEQTPMPFDCTNGLDNDCDGKIDHEDQTELDIVIFVDWSGSMIRTLADVRTGLIRFMDLLAHSPHVRIATVVFPDEFEDGRCALLQEFVSLSEAKSTIEQLEIKRVGIEPPYLCLHQAATGELGLGFRPSADIIFLLFTDEPNFANDLTQEDVAEAMNSRKAVAHFFVDPLFQYHYRIIVELTSETMDDLEGGDLGERLFSRLISQTCTM